MRPIEATDFPFYFEFDGDYFVERKRGQFFIKTSEGEKPISIKSPEITYGLGSGKVITEEEYQQAQPEQSDI